MYSYYNPFFPTPPFGYPRPGPFPVGGAYPPRPFHQPYGRLPGQYQPLRPFIPGRFPWTPGFDVFCDERPTARPQFTPYEITRPTFPADSIFLQRNHSSSLLDHNTHTLHEDEVVSPHNVHGNNEEQDISFSIPEGMDDSAGSDELACLDNAKPSRRYQKARAKPGGNILEELLGSKIASELEGAAATSFYRREPDLKALKHYLLSGKTSHLRGLDANRKRVIRYQASSYAMDGGKLFALRKNGEKLEYVETGPARNAILTKIHGDYGHIRREEMLRRIAEKYHWKSVKEDVEFHIDNCVECQRRGKGLLKVRDTLKQVKIPSKAWYIVEMDLVELPITRRGNRYILVLIDHFTKWIELVPMLNKEALTVALALFDIYCRVGAPHRIVTDNGKEFANEVNKELHRLVKTKHHFIRPYTPRENGMTEQQNRSLKDALKVECGKLQDSWDLCLQKAAFNLRNRTHRATGFRPHELFYSFHLRREPGDENSAEEEEFVKVMEHDDIGLDDYVNRECTRMNKQLGEVAELLREETAANIVKKQARQKRSFEMCQMGKGELLQKGQLVMFRDRNATQKIWGKKAKEFKGPGTVVRVFASKAQVQYGKVKYTVDNGDIRVQKHPIQPGLSLTNKSPIRPPGLKHPIQQGRSQTNKSTIKGPPKRKRWESETDEQGTAAEETGHDNKLTERPRISTPVSDHKAEATGPDIPSAVLQMSPLSDYGAKESSRLDKGMFDVPDSFTAPAEFQSALEASALQASFVVLEQNRAQSAESDVTVEYNRYECLFPSANQITASEGHENINTAYPVPTPEWLESLQQSSFTSSGAVSAVGDACGELASVAFLAPNPKPSVPVTAAVHPRGKKTTHSTPVQRSSTRSILTRSMSEAAEYQKAMNAKWMEVKSKTDRLHDSSVILQEKDRLAILDIKVDLPKEVQGWVSDQVIHGSNVLLQDKYPEIGGLSAPTSFETNPKRRSLFRKNVRVVQCILIKGSHWIVVDSHNPVQNVPGQFVVYILDSMGRDYPLLDSRELMRKVAVLVNTSESVIPLRFCACPQQSNGKDCGILVAAIMYSACAGKSMQTQTFAESMTIRRHLLKCLTSGEITEFPPGNPLLFAAEMPEVWHAREYRVACECRLPTAGKKLVICRMKSCPVKTFHLDCVRPKGENFACERCTTAVHDRHPEEDRKQVGSLVTLDPDQTA